MKDVELRVTCELIRNSRESDRALARTIGVSQPTVSRIRTRLEKEGVIEYGGVPNLGKLGFEIIAVTFANWKHGQNPDEEEQKNRDYLKGHPNVIFVSTGRGMDSDRITVSVHKNYSDYTKYMQELNKDWAEFITVTGTFLISVYSDNMVRPITFKYLADCMMKPQ
jgi:DNA-binding Lrp family transcriptional regulator